MATITLTIADAKVPEIQAVLAAYNAEHGTSLTIQQWIKRLVAREVYRADIQDASTNAYLAKEAEARALAATAEESILTSI